MIERDMAKQARDLARWFPVVSVTGPRQSGKSTLVRDVSSGYAYANLEDPQVRASALSDPVSFVRNRPEHLIIDGTQYAPDLFSMVQVVSDERGAMGQYVLSGSQNFFMLKAITQSLAGRVGMLRLLPFSYREALRGDGSLTPDDYMLAGGYPRLYDTRMPLGTFFENYVSTYLERDVAGFLDVRNLSTFRTFLGLCARNCGGLLRYVTLEQGAQVAHDSKVEVDLIDLTVPQAPELMEVKSSATYHPSYARHLGKVGDLLGVPESGRAVVLRVDDDYSAGGVTVRGVRSELLGMPR